MTTMTTMTTETTNSSMGWACSPLPGVIIIYATRDEALAKAELPGLVAEVNYRQHCNALPMRFTPEDISYGQLDAALLAEEIGD